MVIFILNKLSYITDKNSIGLYREDKLFGKLSGPQLEQRKKKIIKMFKDCGFPITVTTNIISLDVFDLTSNMKTEREHQTTTRYIWTLIRIIHLKH